MKEYKEYKLNLDWVLPTLMLFIVLKLSGVLTISWWIVLMPLWYAIISTILFIAFIGWREQIRFWRKDQINIYNPT